mmetsp:Transcript_63028/g.74551  ORF Transcript_63028/g.74551 Transcript_63028/m.74551 type:complete len:271 (-) Transcript_63028:213-1025(-)
MTFKRKVKAKTEDEDVKAAPESESKPSDASASDDTPSRNRTSVVGFIKSFLTPLNVMLAVLVVVTLSTGGPEDDGKTNLRNEAKTPDAKATVTPDAKAAETPEEAAPPKFTGVTGTLLDANGIESVLNSGRTNIALKKPAAQISDYKPSDGAGNAVDGNRSGDNFSHTNGECNGWWQVDLQGVYSVEDIIIFNRAGPDFILDRLSDFFVEVLNLNGEAWDTTGKYHSAGSAGLKAGYHFEPGAKGSVVRILLNGCEVLHMEQVEVYGTPV